MKAVGVRRLEVRLSERGEVTRASTRKGAVARTARVLGVDERLQAAAAALRRHPQAGALLTVAAREAESRTPRAASLQWTR